MSWEDFEWPNLSPGFPVPEPLRQQPPKPRVPGDIEARVAHAEHRRSLLVHLCLGLGTLFFAGGLVIFTRVGVAPATAVAWALLGFGLLALFPLAALVALVIGPTWQQRQEHWQLLHWQSERRRWLNGERERYLASLPPSSRQAFRDVLGVGHGIQ
ncbi:MAG: hypothetical protein ACLQUY_04125 [Ktedonobacterales bacterium]